MECNRRLEELREAIATFLSQTAEDYVYWVERSGKAQRNLSLNAAPIVAADYMLQRPLAASEAQSAKRKAQRADSMREKARNPKPETRDSPLNYFARRIGGEEA